MHDVLLLGAGKIGGMIAKLLTDSGDYRVTVVDAQAEPLARLARDLRVATLQVDVQDRVALARHLRANVQVISALSYRFNRLVAELALEHGCSYFDLTEDVATTRAVRELARRAVPGQIFMPQCGLAPGFISIVARHLTEDVERLDRLHMRVGALPEFPTGQLKYNLTWSTDGLINEYCNPCEAIQDGKRCELLPLEGLEQFSLDGVRYEAFNTSGGLGTLCETLDGRIRELNYKTVRYQGHRQLMQFLIDELRLRERREVLQDILENAVPITLQDVVVTFCTVSGWRDGHLVQISDARKIYARSIDGRPWSAIQIATAAGLCAVLDLHTHDRLPRQGFVKQEEVNLTDFLTNRFGKVYCTSGATRYSHASAKNDDDSR